MCDDQELATKSLLDETVRDVYFDIDLEIGDMNFYTALGNESIEKIGDLLIELMIDDYLEEPTDEKLD